ncbi:MAG: hypothetical protein ACFE8N_07805 [Promethearchaeota archaeon]
MGKEHIPIIVGAAQFTQRKGTPQPLDSLNLMVKTGQKTIENTQNSKIVDYIDAVYMVNISSWSYEDAPGELSKRLNINVKEKLYLPDGGHSPQMLINQAAKAITSGKHRCILITGGEAAYTAGRTYSRENPPPHWPKRVDPKYINGEHWKRNKIDKDYYLNWPSLTYAILETSIRASSGRSVEEHRNYMGELFEKFSKIAANNPYSWSQKHYTAEEITTPAPDNRIVTYPYTKRMCANNLVDQAATIIVTSEEVAELLSIDKSLWVYIMGGAVLKNVDEIYRRPRLDDSPAAREGIRLALEQAGLEINEIDKFDLYSCFPSIVEIFLKELGLNEDDPRDLTVTGGLPFFGTPLSNYSLHAVINTVEKIRANPSLKVMVIANGGYNTKQSVGIYGTLPPKISWGTRDDSKIQQSIYEEALPEPLEKANGKFKVDGYSIFYHRTGEPVRGVIIGTLENGIRSVAIIDGNPDVFSRLETQELVGKIVKVQYDPVECKNMVVSLD